MNILICHEGDRSCLYLNNYLASSGELKRIIKVNQIILELCVGVGCSPKSLKF